MEGYLPVYMRIFISNWQSARKPLESDHGDPFTLINAFDEWIKVGKFYPSSWHVYVYDNGL